MATRNDAGSSGSEESYEVIADGRYLRLVLRNDWECVERRGITGIVVMAALGLGLFMTVDRLQHLLCPYLSPRIATGT